MVRHHVDRYTCPAIFASREGCAMTPVTAAKVKYGVWGLIGGAIIAMIIGFVWGGWTTTRTTRRLGDEAVLAARAAICVAQFMQQPNPQEKLHELAKVYSYPTLSSPIREKFDIVDRLHPQTSVGFSSAHR